MAKPNLAIVIGQALKDKGKAKHSPDDEMVESDAPEADDKRDKVKQIADEMLTAIDSKDSEALTDLLLELIEC